MSDVTLVLHAIQSGDPEAPAQLLPLVYEELRRLARRRLAHEAPGQTLQPTALVHEVYLRLIGDKKDVSWDSRGRFFSAAAQAMRRILIENARRKHRFKRCVNLTRRSLEEAELLAPQPREDVLALDEALTELAATDRAAAELVQLRYFGGLSSSEAAQVLGVSKRTAERLWTFARAWLRDRVQDTRKDDNPA
jgi:RNA polymerase sigma factor (TIGR02999 family)